MQHCKQTSSRTGDNHQPALGSLSSLCPQKTGQAQAASFTKTYTEGHTLEGTGNWTLPTCHHVEDVKDVEVFSGGIKAFPTHSEKAMEVVKVLKEIIPRLGLSQSLQSGNGPSFTSK